MLEVKDYLQIATIIMALIGTTAAVSIHFHNKKLEKVKGQLENLYLKLNYIIQVDYKFLQMNTPDDEE